MNRIGMLERSVSNCCVVVCLCLFFLSLSLTRFNRPTIWCLKYPLAIFAPCLIKLAFHLAFPKGCCSTPTTSRWMEKNVEHCCFISMLVCSHNNCQISRFICQSKRMKIEIMLLGKHVWFASPSPRNEFFEKKCSLCAKEYSKRNKKKLPFNLR